MQERIVNNFFILLKKLGDRGYSIARLSVGIAFNNVIAASAV